MRVKEIEKTGKGKYRERKEGGKGNKLTYLSGITIYC